MTPSSIPIVITLAVTLFTLINSNIIVPPGTSIPMSLHCHSRSVHIVLSSPFCTPPCMFGYLDSGDPCVCCLCAPIYL